MSSLYNLPLVTARNNSTVNRAGNAVTVLDVPPNVNLRIGLGIGGVLTPVKTGDRLFSDAGFSYLRISNEAQTDGMVAVLFIADAADQDIYTNADTPAGRSTNMFATITGGGDVNTAFVGVASGEGVRLSTLTISSDVATQWEFAVGTSFGITGFCPDHGTVTLDLRYVYAAADVFTLYNYSAGSATFNVLVTYDVITLLP